MLVQNHAGPVDKGFCSYCKTFSAVTKVEVWSPVVECMRCKCVLHVDCVDVETSAEGICVSCVGLTRVYQPATRHDFFKKQGRGDLCIFYALIMALQCEFALPLAAVGEAWSSWGAELKARHPLTDKEWLGFQRGPSICGSFKVSDLLRGLVFHVGRGKFLFTHAKHNGHSLDIVDLFKEEFAKYLHGKQFLVVGISTNGVEKAVLEKFKTHDVT